MYDNPWGKVAIGIGLGYVGHKQKWSPDVTVPDPMINSYSQFFQFMFDKCEKNNLLFDDKKIDQKTSFQNTNDNEKSDK